MKLQPKITRGLSSPGVKTYREHRCSSRHRSYPTMARCVWPRAAWIMGNGEWAAVSRCRRSDFSVSLFEARAEAEEDLQLPCGGSCCGEHEVIRIVLP
jgi:hypothetical protein